MKTGVQTHIKYDVLGLENLAVVKDTLDSIKEETGEVIDLKNMDLEQEEVYTELSKGNVSGVFQLSAQGHMVKEQKPTQFRDLIAINSLIRPGVGDFNEYLRRRRGGKYKLEEERKGHMAETFGLYTYQEQYMLDTQVYAGWDIAFADKNVRKNKDIANDVALEKKFVADGMANGYPKEKLESIWKGIVGVVDGGYGFCKGHATSYAKTSYVTMWLKVNYPTHFYAGLMTSKGDDRTALSQLIHEARDLGVNISAPDINNSTDKFKAKGNTIYYRITSVTSVGPSAIKAIERCRPFKSVEDLIERTTRSEIKTNVIANLIKAGCFDWQDTNRSRLLNKVYKILKVKCEDEPTYTEQLKWEYEKDSLGIYLTGHPLDKYHYRPLSAFSDGDTVIQAGEVDEVVVRKDKSGNDMAFVTLNTKNGMVRCLIFASSWKKKGVQEFLEQNKFIQIKGKLSGESVLLNQMERV